MPRIPDIGDLGQRRVPRTAGGIVSNRAGEIIGAALAEAGDAIEGYQDRLRANQDRLEVSKAESHLLTRDSEITSEIDSNPDWAAHDKQYTSSMAKAREEASQMISNGQLREEFLVKTEGTVARGREAVRRNARNLEVRQGRQEALNDGDALLNGALQAQDERIRGEYLAAVGNRFDSAAASGYMNPEEAKAYKRKIGETYATGRLDALPLRERVNMLENYQGTPAAMLPEPERIQRLSIESERLKAEEERLRREREQNARIAQAEARDALRESAADAFAMRASGNKDATLPPRSLYIAAYGADGAKRYEQDQRMFTVYDTVATAVTLPGNEGRAMIEAYRPAEQEGAASQARAWMEARQLYDQQRKEIEKDPAAFIVQNDRQTAALYQEVVDGSGGPGAATQYAHRVRSRAEAMGVEPKLLPASAAESLAGKLRFDPQNPKARPQAMTELKEVWGKNYQQVIREIGPKLEGDARIIANMAIDDAARYDQALAQGPKILESNLSDSQKLTINEAVDEAIAPYAETVYAHPDGESRIGEVRDAVRLMTVSMVNRKGEVKESAKRAAEMVLNTRETTYIQSLQIPTTFDADTVVRGTDSVRSGLKVSDLAVNPTTFGDKATAQREVYDLVQKEGAWFTLPDGNGAELRAPIRGQWLPVKLETPNGRVPVRRTWAELEMSGSARTEVDDRGGTGLGSEFWVRH